MNAVSARDGMLDRMRGGAALAVVFFHYFHAGIRDGWIPATRIPVLYDIAGYGYLGVHLFFMISGYVIMMTAQNAGLRQFAASRVSRLVPAFWICMVLTVLVQWAIPAAPFHLESAWQFVTNLTLMPNWFGQAPIDGVYWSLEIEITFYLMVALVIALGQLHRIETLLCLWLAMSLVNLVRPIYPLQLFAVAHWAPFFAAGAFFFLVRQSGWTARRRAAVAVAALLALGYAAREFRALPTREQLFSLSQGPNFLVVLGLVLCFFAAFWRLANAPRVSEPTPASDLMGRLTYPLYLIHQNVGYALFTGAVAAGWIASEGNGWFAGVLVLLAIAIAWGVNVWVEQPLSPRLRRLVGGARRPRAEATGVAPGGQTPTGGV